MGRAQPLIQSMIILTLSSQGAYRSAGNGGNGISPEQYTFSG